MAFWDRVRESVGWDREDERDRDRWGGARPVDRGGNWSRGGYDGRWGSGDYRRDEEPRRDYGRADYGPSRYGRPEYGRDQYSGPRYGYGRDDYGRNRADYDRDGYGRDRTDYAPNRFASGSGYRNDYDRDRPGGYRGPEDYDRDRYADRWSSGRMRQGSYDDYDRGGYGFGGRPPVSSYGGANYGGEFNDRDHWNDRGGRPFDDGRDRDRDRSWREDEWDRNRNRW